MLEAKIKETGWSYLKSPAGIFTEATLPYKDISEKLATDTLNSVKLTFTNYAQENNNKYEFSMSTPETVLLLRKKDMDTFFVNNELANNVTSFVATHNSVETNQYTFKNIARLVSTCINEKKAAKQKAKEAAGVSWDEAAWEAEWSREGGEGADWDKVVLIPVVVTYDTNSTNPSIISIQHDLKPTYAKLKGEDPAYGGNNLLLDKAKIAYELIPYEVDEKDLSAIHVAASLGEDIEQVFKTLILHGDKTGYFVCVIPGEHEVDLKLAAKVSGNKKCDLIPMKELLPLTGYIRGGCSPIGMKKPFPTYIHETCLQFSYIYISAGQRGLQLKLNPKDLIKEVHAEVCRLFEA